MTHYDILGVPPGADVDDVELSFFNLSKPLLPDHPHGISSMRRSQNLRKLITLCEAMLVVGNSDRSKIYDLQLRHNFEICSLCEGRGWVGMGEKDFYGKFSQRIDCAACCSTGKSEPAPSVKTKV